MLVVMIHNDGTGTQTSANYDVDVLVTLTPTQLESLAKLRVIGHDRGHGWPALLRQIADAAEKVGIK